MLCNLTMLVKKITSKFHTFKAIHNPSGKTVDLATVLQPTQSDTASSGHSGCSKHNGTASWATIRTLAQPAFETPKSNTSFYMKEKKNISACLSQKLCSDPRNPYYFINKHTYTRTHTNTFTHTKKHRIKRNPPPFIRRALFTAWSYPQ